MDPTFFGELIKSQGIGIAILALMVWYFIRRDAGREKDTREREIGLVDRIQKTEDFVKNKLLDLLTANSIAMTAHTLTEKEHATAIKDLAELINARPCYVKED